MSSTKTILHRSWQTLLWANSVALAWTWGIGLFFAVQVAVQFGYVALIKFATIDAIGLSLFGVINQRFIGNLSGEEFEAKFLQRARNFKFALFFYQFLAITLTLYCFLKYVTLPLGIFSFLVGMMFVGIVIYLGEEYPITKIKYSHAVIGLVMFAALICLVNSELFTSSSLISAVFNSGSGGLTAQVSLNADHLSWIEQAMSYRPLYKFSSDFAQYAFWIPVILGFLCGPWLDLQHWQRAIQIRKEDLSVSDTYILAGVIFWLILIIDGSIALACYQYGENKFPEFITSLSNIEVSSLLYPVKDIITQVLYLEPNFNLLLGLYMAFVGLASLTTFDSGYIAFKWYAEDLMKDAKSIIFSFLPTRALSSPIPWFTVCIVIAITTMHFSQVGKFIAKYFDRSFESFFRFELEYYLAFFASFFLVYAVCFYRSISGAVPLQQRFSALKIFSTALLSIAVFGMGYFSENTVLMAIGSLIPFAYGWFTRTKLDTRSEQPESQSSSNPKLITPSAQVIDLGEFRAQDITAISDLPQGAKPAGIKGCYIQDGWFVHRFIPTYQDTNSVGNVYFAMYLMWVGKTRELFFLQAVPNFDPKTSEYLILTRSIDHKFQKEIKEFDEVTIQIKIADYNRKFVTLEHQILDLKGELVGKGKQVLMFVDSKNYGLVDLPTEVQQGFMPYVSEVKSFVKTLN